jgi:hypothetical protein
MKRLKRLAQKAGGRRRSQECRLYYWNAVNNMLCATKPAFWKLHLEVFKQDQLKTDRFCRFVSLEDGQVSNFHQLKL